MDLINGTLSSLSSIGNDSFEFGVTAEATAAAEAAAGFREQELSDGASAAATAGAGSGAEVEPINVANLVWTISFTVIVVVGTCGNGIVLWIILGKAPSTWTLKWTANNWFQKYIIFISFHRHSRARNL